MPSHTRGLFFKCGASVSGGSASTAVLVLFSALLVGGQRHQHRVTVATVGEAVLLPCHLETAADASDMVVEWTRADLEPELVLVWRDRKELVDLKLPSFQRRTSLSISKLKLGDASLQISAVRLSDAGTYRCRVHTLGQESLVELRVGSVSDPTIEVVSDNDAELVLECRSGGWFPEPELLWLDAEGNLLSAGPPETVRGSDDLYTVSSRVTVERHSSRYTCRVQQRTINQNREAHILVKYYFHCELVDYAPIIITIIVVCLVTSVFFIVIYFYIYKAKLNPPHGSKTQ